MKESSIYPWSILLDLPTGAVLAWQERWYLKQNTKMRLTTLTCIVKFSGKTIIFVHISVKSNGLRIKSTFVTKSVFSTYWFHLVASTPTCLTPAMNFEVITCHIRNVSLARDFLESKNAIVLPPVGVLYQSKVYCRKN